MTIYISGLLVSYTASQRRLAIDRNARSARIRSHSPLQVGHWIVTLTYTRRLNYRTAIRAA